ncbi:fibronectin type III domain-containing protein [Polaribacter sp. Hel1_85]|uniref:fibronectin type III domain-containing protein n=1 Tax=Polaribacter sp. Hel1_85 TaxID=1250005 RepID=UPI00052E0444|nr:fibronectin type III domain-containing protein [Polaribacter sp. Hel1_85]KGL58890.1 fibronectin type III domain protein-containing protein [Polaribacter sp. Hel1_85]
MDSRKLFLLLFMTTLFQVSFSQENKGVINIDTKNGHAIKIGSSGFNVRIADKSWSYLHPDFRKAVHLLKPGWLRYFSGTMGDAFSSATGHYDLDYAMMFDHPKEYLKGYSFLDVKGAHRIIDLYQLLSKINGKLVITINGFTETPEMTRELARFCKNNNIEVATWQFCNEPYFYVPHRERYWWNDGYDYAAKMKPHADAIKEIYPDAFLALNNTWDGIWGFMKEINKYQKEQGAYWNVFSKHSYAPHIGKKESVEKAYKRANTKLLEATSANAMQEIEDYSWKDVPMVITEFGVWNRPLNGIYSSIYNIEYVMRQLNHKNTWYVGAHEVSSKYAPKKNINEQIEDAFKNGIKLNTDSVLTGINKTLEGKAYEIYHDVTNHSDFIFDSNVTNGFKAPGLKKAIETGFYTQAYRGINGYDYLVFTNRTKESKDFDIKIDGHQLNKEIEVNFISADSIKVKNTEIRKVTFSKGKINIPSFSVSVAKWKSKLVTKPANPTIYKGEILSGSIKLTWGPIENVKKYTINYKEVSSDVIKQIKVDATENSIEIPNLNKGATYNFKMSAENKQGVSDFSNKILIKNDIPEIPEIFKISRRNNTATIFWKSVAEASGYKIKYINKNTKEESIIETNNVYGYRLKGLEYNVPYDFSVVAYNGNGLGEFSKTKTVSLSKKVPYSPRNVSAIRQPSGSVSVKWIEQDSILPETSYNVYRGLELHKYHKIASGIKKSSFKDTSTKKDEIYFYTVKAETSAGESNFYPNTATLFSSDDEYSIKIKSIKKQKDGYLLKIKFKNILLDGDYSYGLKIENISYLTVEENKIEGRNLSKKTNTFEVFIPNSVLNKKSKYALKAFVNTNGKSLFSKLPHRNIKTD